jgi:hypothetical protein
MGFGVQDSAVSVSRALPSAASTTVNSTGIQLQGGGVKLNSGDFLANVEFVISAPALTTTMAPDTKTMTYNVVMSDKSDMSSPTTLIAGAIVQTGAGGAGAAAATYTFRVPVDVLNYLFLQVVSGANITDSSSLSATLSLRA